MTKVKKTQDFGLIGLIRVENVGDKWEIFDRNKGEYIGKDYDQVYKPIVHNQRYAMAFIKDGDTSIIFDGTPLNAGYVKIKGLQFSPDGRRIGYIGMLKTGEFVAMSHADPHYGSSKGYFQSDPSKSITNLKMRNDDISFDIRKKGGKKRGYSIALAKLKEEPDDTDWDAVFHKK
ncbi:MAG: hypothetical protein WC650_02490 [Candidatus Doudnabacteria bacterium]